MVSKITGLQKVVITVRENRAVVNHFNARDRQGSNFCNYYGGGGGVNKK